MYSMPAASSTDAYDEAPDAADARVFERSAPDSKKLFGKTFARRDRSGGPSSAPPAKKAKPTGSPSAAVKSPITQGSANKSRSVVSSPAAQKEFNAINQMFQNIDATALDMEPTEKAKPAEAEKEKEKGTSKSTGTTKKATKAKGKEAKAKGKRR